MSRDESVSQKTANKEWKLKFQRSPVELLSGAIDGERVAGVRFELNDLVEVKSKVTDGPRRFRNFFLGKQKKKRREGK